jgi:hypothetical protein
MNIICEIQKNPERPMERKPEHSIKNYLLKIKS